MSGIEVLALTGGIGGAKLALGLSRLLPAGALACLVNTGDDFEHLGLHISPDLDTTLYTLAGLANPELGWGRRDETWSFMQRAGGAGRRKLVPPRRCRPGAARRTHAPTGGR